MVRPCFLIVDREFPGSISTRKLVVETAKFNVITAYSGVEALETLRLFPAIHGIVMDQDMKDIPCSDLVRGLKEIHPTIPVVLIGTPGHPECSGTDYELTEYSPKALLDILQKIEPQATAFVNKREAMLMEDDMKK